MLCQDKVRRSLGYENSTAQYGEITEIPGHRLRKPIEVAVFEGDPKTRGGPDFTATHYGPTSDMKGELFKACGSSPEEACRKLGRGFIVRLESLRENGIRVVGDIETLKAQIQYFESLFVFD